MPPSGQPDSRLGHIIPFSRFLSAARRRRLPSGLTLLLAGVTFAHAQTLPDLLTAPELTPRRFARFFEDFDYEYHEAVQPAATFLARRRGDCDDYSVLADHVLRHHGYRTRLIHVRLVARVAHAVCYVDETGVYLDYNHRQYFFKLQRSGATLREIAERVAEDLEANWTSVSEFTFEYAANRKRIVRTVVKAMPAELDADVRQP